MQKLLTSRLLHVLILVLFLMMLIFVRVGDPGWLQLARFRAFDMYNKFQPREPLNNVVIVDIDESSLREENQGQWPWSRHVIGDLVTNLKDMGARSIVFDMVFAEQDRTSPEKIIARLPEEHLDPAVVSSLQSLPDPDNTFANDIANAGNVVMGFIWSNNKSATRETPTQSKPIIVSKAARLLQARVPAIHHVVSSLPMFEKAAAGNGSFGVMTSGDGIIREVPLLFRLDKILYPSLAIEGLRVAEDPDRPIKVRDIKPEESELFSPPFLMQIGKHYIPLNESGLFYVHYSKPRMREYIPAWKVLDKSLDPDRIKDKIVLVGTSAEGLKDLRSTPLNLFVPGVEVHLNVIEQIFQQRYLLRPSLMEGVELIFTFAVGIMVIGFSPFVNPFALAAVTLLMMSGISFLSVYAYVEKGLLLDPVYPSIAIFALSICAALFSYLRSEIERRAVRQAFGLYISPAFMNELTKDPDKLRLGGEIRDISVMFTDIRNFTTISERLPPADLIQLMNDFLTPMSDLVMSHRGTIDKYMGDAMMAFWNAPLDDPDHARNACIAALEMNKALIPINDRLKQMAADKGQEPILLKAGIGVNTGPGAVGNMGSKQRFAYSVLGDTVNLASRLESQTKAYGVEFLIGENTWVQVSDFAGLELDLIKVKGKKLPVRIHTILGDQNDAKSGDFQKLRAAHNDILASYRAMQWEKALDLINKINAPASVAGYYTMLAERITDLAKTPPANDWDGVYEAKSK